MAKNILQDIAEKDRLRSVGIDQNAPMPKIDIEEKPILTSPLTGAGSTIGAESGGYDYIKDLKSTGQTSSKDKPIYPYQDLLDIQQTSSIYKGEPAVAGPIQEKPAPTPTQTPAPTSTQTPATTSTQEPAPAPEQPKSTPTPQQFYQPIATQKISTPVQKIEPFDNNKIDLALVDKTSQEIVNAKGYEIQKEVIDLGNKTTDRDVSIKSSQQILAEKLSEQQAMFTLEVKSVKDGFEKLINETDIESQEILRDSQEDLNVMYEEMVGIEARLDKMNTDELQIYNDVIAEMAGKASQSYINAVVAKRKKELYPEKYALQREYNIAVQKYQYYDSSLNQKKAEIAQERKDRYSMMTEELNFLQKQQQTQFSQMGTVGQLFIEGEQAQAEMARAEEETRLEREKWLVETSMKIAKLPKGFSTTIDGKIYRGLEENDEYSIQQVIGNQGAGIFRINKNTGEAERVVDLGSYYQTNTEKATEEERMLNLAHRKKLELEAFKRGDIEFINTGTFMDLDGLRDGDLAPAGNSGRQCGVFLNLKYGKEYFGGNTWFGDSFNDKQKWANSSTPGVGYGFVQDNGTETGHCGIVQSVSADGKTVFVKDANRDGDGKIREYELDVNKISGFIAPQGLMMKKNGTPSEQLQKGIIADAYFGRNKTASEREKDKAIAEKLGGEFLEDFNFANNYFSAREELNLTPAKVKNIAQIKEVENNLDDLFRLMKSENITPAQILWDDRVLPIGVGSNEVRSIISNLTNVFGRVDSGAAITEDEWKRFKQMFTTNLISGDIDAWGRNVKRSFQKFEIMGQLNSFNIDPFDLEKKSKKLIDKYSFWENKSAEVQNQISITDNRLNELDSIVDNYLEDEDLEDFNNGEKMLSDFFESYDIY